MYSTNNIIKLALFGTLLLGLSAHAQPEEMRFKRISIQEGLSQSVVFSVIQDHNGFIWLGTGNGLCKYDGHRFVIYQQLPGDSTSLSNSNVRVVFQDSRQNIWAGTSAGLNRLAVRQDPVSGNRQEGFVHYRHDPDDSLSLGDEDVWSIYEDRHGTLWVGTANGLNRLEADGEVVASDAPESREKFIRYQNDPDDPHTVPRNRLPAILEDEDGHLWLGSIGGGLVRFDPGSGTAQRYRHDPDNPSSLGSNFVMTLYRDRAGSIWIGSYGGGLSRFDSATERFTHFLPDTSDLFSISENKVFAINEDARGFLWIGTFGGGLNKFDPRSGRFLQYRHNLNDPQSISNDFVRKILIDRSRNIWLATNAGINLADLKGAKFTHYHHDPQNPNSLRSNHISALWESHYHPQRPELWIGHQGGLERLDLRSNRLTFFAVDHHNPKGPNGFVYSICEDRSGTLWIGAFGGGLYRFHRGDGTLEQFTHHPDDPHSLGSNRVHNILEDRRGRLWISTAGGGLNRMVDRANGRFQRYLHDENDPTTLSDNSVFRIYQGRDSTLWVGTANGLNRFDPENGTFRRYLHDTGDPHSLSYPTVRAVFEDARGVLWVGTDQGLSRLAPEDRERGRFTHYFERDGLPGNVITAIEADSGGRLWIGTYRGLACFDEQQPPGKQFRNYDVRDGLQSNEFNTGASFHGASGKLYFGGINGFNCFDPDSVTDNPFPPQVALTEFRINDRVRRAGQALVNTRQITLDYDERFFAFEFVALEFTNPEKQQYAYKLEGFDPDWIHTGDRRYASYTNLDAGRYTFRVKAANNDGVWNEAGISLELRILPPFWETWWFRLLILAALLTAIWALHRYRVSKLLEIERVRVRIASDLHDDVGSTLTKIALYSDLIRGSGDVSEQNRLLEKIGTMSREMVVSMSDIVWSIDARNDSMADLIDRMRDFAATLFSARNIDYAFTVQSLDMEQKLPITWRQNVYLIFKEAVNNVARHSGASRVEINLHRADGHFQMVIRDNGRGMNTVRKKTGHGLKNMQMRAQRLNGQLTLQNGEGTEVRLSVKMV